MTVLFPSECRECKVGFVGSWGGNHQFHTCRVSDSVYVTVLRDNWEVLGVYCPHGTDIGCWRWCNR